jgi:WD40-like Beta Propeller Repeat/RTX calcium-binding nonapeptide repeat (4 copies)
MALVSKRTLALALLACLFVLAPIGAHATASGPVGPIVYVAGGTRIAVASASGTVIDNTHGPLGSSPTLSPAVQKIAYISGTGAATVLRVVTWDGSNFGTPATVATVANLQSVAWSPSGLRLAYSDGTDIFVINADGTGAAPNLTNSGGAANIDPTWSPDGAEIAFSKGSGGLFSIYRMSSTDGSNQTKLSASTTDGAPTWSPDGTTIAFTSSRDGRPQIYKVPTAGGPEVRLSNENADDYDASYSPAGDKIVLVQAGNLATMNVNGGTVTAFAGPVAGDTPEWGLSFGPLAPPSISPSSGITDGTVVSASNGTWSATPSSFAYQWQRCNSAGASCSAISGATSQTYTVTSSDQGSTLRITVTATASSGSGSSTSGPTSLIQQAQSVAGLPPTVVEVPTMFVSAPFGQTPPPGQIVVGSSFSAGLGIWRGQFPLSYGYQWKKCDATGSCFTILNATSSSFTPGLDLFGWRIAVTVAATNTLGRAEATSQAWGPLTAVAPVGTVTPLVTGTNVLGETLSVATGTFTGSTPFTYSYQWRRCDAAGTLPSCVAIPGATSSTYILKEADLGAALRAYVTATNPAGSDTLITNHTLPPLPKPKFAPSATALPTILGNPIPGLKLQMNRGTWTGDDPITYAIVWQRCNATGAGCVTVSKKPVYAVTNADAGMRLRLQVTAKNGNGTVSALSGLTDAIQLTQHRKGRTIRGNGKANYLAGGGFDDVIYGLGGNDTLLGGTGADKIYGGPGADVIVGGTGADRIDGGPGSDTIMASDGDRDVIDCGEGADRAVVDAIDVVSNCESVQVASGATPTPTTSSTTSSTTSATTTTTPRS